MNKLIKLCEEKSIIIEILSNNFPNVKYSIENIGLDCRLEFFDIDDYVLEEVLECLEYAMYADVDKSLAEIVVELLYLNNINIATAESCTGGLVASSLISVPGSSEVFYEGIVAYSNISKILRLSVAEDTISEYGAVSSETALEMAQGLLSENVIIGVSTTGIAGPSGGSISKPVGTVYITVADEEHFITKDFLILDSRNNVRVKATQKALFMIIAFIIKYYKV